MESRTESQLERKLSQLKESLRNMGSAVLAYSGGVDSSFLLKVAVSVLGDRVLAVIARSATYPDEELSQAIELAEKLGARYVVIDTDELSDPRFSSNPPDRCYYCKHELFGKLSTIAHEKGFGRVIDGSNVDDLRDTRPGARAAAELSVSSPLKEAGLTKSEIRQLSRSAGLPTWSKPAQACLASRFPYGSQIVASELRKVAVAEGALRKLGFSQVRVRVHGETARVEVLPEELEELLSPGKRAAVVDELKKAGFFYVSIDLEGYRTGSMNEPLGAGPADSGA